MEKVLSKEQNELNADVYINGHINVKRMPDAILKALLAGLETDIAAYYDKKKKRSRKKHNKVI